MNVNDFEHAKQKQAYAHVQTSYPNHYECLVQRNRILIFPSYNISELAY